MLISGMVYTKIPMVSFTKKAAGFSFSRKTGGCLTLVSLQIFFQHLFPALGHICLKDDLAQTKNPSR